MQELMHLNIKKNITNKATKPHVGQGFFTDILLFN